MYKTNLLPLENEYEFPGFVSPALGDADFDSKPMVLMLGQYSTGKTTFIRYLLEQDYPGMRIGPEPTTDSFTVIMHGEQNQIIPGNALTIDKNRQFRPLSDFGGAFLNRFQAATMRNEVLKYVTLVDTPGILAGEKQRIDRGYDFIGVLQWFAERSDIIILLFDANKLDISDEFRRAIKSIHGYEDKVRIVLNKADQVNSQELMRVYGALMWSISKVISAPECPKVYTGTFHDQPLKYDLYRLLFEEELKKLFDDLQDLPRNAALRKLNDFIKRARMAKLHAFMISTLREQMPKIFKKEKQKAKLIKNLPSIIEDLQSKHKLNLLDLPEINSIQEKLKSANFLQFPKLNEKLISQVNKMLDTDIAQLMSVLPSFDEELCVRGGVFRDTQDDSTPFGYQRCEGTDKGSGEPGWIVSKERPKWDKIFDSLNPHQDKLSGAEAKREMVRSGLPNSVLAKIWKLSDVDEDGMLNRNEFALAKHLIHIKLDGHEIPDVLPAHLYPPASSSIPSTSPSNGHTGIIARI